MVLSGAPWALLQLPHAGRPVQLRVPDGHNTIIFVRKGAIAVGPEGTEQEVGAQGVALMNREGTAVRLVAKAAETQVLLLGGQPIDEPIEAQGPFVMNTRAEIVQANSDFRAGKMGR